MHQKVLPSFAVSPAVLLAGETARISGSSAPSPAAAEKGIPKGRVPLALPRAGAARRAGEKRKTFSLASINRFFCPVTRLSGRLLFLPVPAVSADLGTVKPDCFQQSVQRLVTERTEPKFLTD